MENDAGCFIMVRESRDMIEQLDPIWDTRPTLTGIEFAR